MAAQSITVVLILTYMNVHTSWCLYGTFTVGPLAICIKVYKSMSTIKGKIKSFIFTRKSSFSGSMSFTNAFNNLGIYGSRCMTKYCWNKKLKVTPFINLDNFTISCNDEIKTSNTNNILCSDNFSGLRWQAFNLRRAHPRYSLAFFSGLRGFIIAFNNMYFLRMTVAYPYPYPLQTAQSKRWNQAQSGFLHHGHWHYLGKLWDNTSKILSILLKLG